MEPRNYELKDGRVLLIREVAVEDARAVLDYVHEISGESDFLSFGPGGFELTEPEEQEPGSHWSSTRSEPRPRGG